MKLENFTLAELKDLAPHIPAIKGLVGLPLVKSYEEFVNVLYDDLDESIAMLEEFRQLHQKDSEDRLSVQILTNLRSKGYVAEHDAQTGGHVDLLVKHMDFKWIGEAKIHSSYDHLRDGFNQLTTRYTTGTDKGNHGGVLIYIFNKDANSVMESWKEKLEDMGVEDLSTEDCSRNPLGFVSKHKHEVSGTQYTTRHIPVLLHFNPQDKSGRNTAQRAA